MNRKRRFDSVFLYQCDSCADVTARVRKQDHEFRCYVCGGTMKLLKRVERYQKK